MVYQILGSISRYQNQIVTLNVPYFHLSPLSNLQDNDNNTITISTPNHVRTASNTRGRCCKRSSSPQRQEEEEEESIQQWTIMAYLLLGCRGTNGIHYSNDIIVGRCMDRDELYYPSYIGTETF